MEQRIGSSSQPLKGEPVAGAGFDPAFIPGLTSPVSEQPEEAKAPDEDVESAEEAAEPAPDLEAETEAEPEAEEEAEASARDDEDDEEAAPEGPVFEASDRRAKIVADHRGVRLALDDQECEFRWDEIGAVETESPRFGKRFTITVHTPDRRWYPIEIEAAARGDFKEWEDQLDAVLDTYFDENADDNTDTNDDKTDDKTDE